MMRIELNFQEKEKLYVERKAYRFLQGAASDNLESQTPMMMKSASIHWFIFIIKYITHYCPTVLQPSAIIYCL